MEWPDEQRLEELVTAASEIGVGAAILGLRRLNIARRELAESVPAAEPVINAILEQIENLTPSISAAAGAAVQAFAETVPGESRERLERTGAAIAELGPELVRLSGLTRRT